MGLRADLVTSKPGLTRRQMLALALPGSLLPLHLDAARRAPSCEALGDLSANFSSYTQAAKHHDTLGRPPNPLPSKVVGAYWTRWNSQIRLSRLPTAYNLIYLFAATSSGGGGVTWGLNGIAADIRVCRARGQRIILSAGGAGQGINFRNRRVSTRFVESVLRINRELGGSALAPAIDGLDFNTFEGNFTPNTTEYQWMGKELKRRFGANFVITSPPAPWKMGDRAFCKAMLAMGAMDYAAPQYYDDPGLANEKYIVSNVTRWVREVARGDAGKIVVGFGIGSQPNYLSIQQIMSTWRQIETRHPDIRGAFLWHHKKDFDRGWTFAKRMAPVEGLLTDLPVLLPPFLRPPCCVRD